MDHADARELLEDAAVEPGGFERLIAGDTIDAAALAGHMAGCPACATEMEMLRRDATVVRDAIRSLPAPDLRDRTLAFVAAVGRPRPVASDAIIAEAPTPTGLDRGSAIGVEAATPGSIPRAGRVGRTAAWAASLAAAVVIAVLGTALVVGPSTRTGDATADQVAALSRVATWSLRIDGEPDARRVDLAATDAAGSGPSGALLFSPGSRELVVLVERLALPPAGQEYRCWMETGSERTRVGRMFFAGDVAFWVGDVPALGDVAGDDVRFGVTLVPAAGDSVEGAPVLIGEL